MSRKVLNCIDLFLVSLIKSEGNHSVDWCFSRCSVLSHLRSFSKCRSWISKSGAGLISCICNKLLLLLLSTMWVGSATVKVYESRESRELYKKNHAYDIHFIIRKGAVSEMYFDVEPGPLQSDLKEECFYISTFLDISAPSTFFNSYLIPIFST